MQKTSLRISEPLLARAKETAARFGVSEAESMRMGMSLGFDKLLRRPRREARKRARSGEKNDG